MSEVYKTLSFLSFVSLEEMGKERTWIEKDGSKMNNEQLLKEAEKDFLKSKFQERKCK